MAVETLNDLLDLVEAGDEDAKERLRGMMATTEQKAALAARDLKLKTDPTLKDRYPRALRALDKGLFSIGDSLDEAGMLEALRTREEEYAQMGVPVETQIQAQAPNVASGEGGVGNVPVVDPAQALAGGRAASSPGGSPHDFVADFFDGVKGSTEHDLARAFAVLPELNKTAAGKEKIAQITEQLSARPITPRGY